jgi:predicted nucleic acid-binding protein
VNRALLDTDIYSEILKAVNPTVTQNATAYRRVYGVLTLSVITMLEIVKGCQQAQATARMQRFLNAVAQEHVLSLDPPAAELAGRIAGDLDRTGQTIGMADPLIAAIALTHNLDLVTGNVTHFQRISQLGYPLTLANWRV